MTSSFLLNFVAYLGISLLVYLAWFGAARYWGRLPRLHSSVAAFVLWNAQVILSELVLGVVFQRLFAVELFALNLLLSLAIIFSYRRSLRATLIRYWQARTTWRWRALLSKRYAVYMLTFGLLAAFVAANLVLILLYGPTSWDDYHYHLNFVADIIRSGSIRNFPVLHSYTISYPHNIELVNLWHVIFLRNDVIVEATNLIFLLFGGWAVFASARQLGVKRLWAVVAAFTVLIVPMNILYVKTTKVDLALVTLFISALFLLWQGFSLEKAGHIGRKGMLFLQATAAISVGIVFGGKPSAIIYVAGFTLAYLLFSIVYRLDWRSWGRVVAAGALLLTFACLLMGSFWYFRSWAEFNNPLYPLEISAGPIHFQGEWEDLRFDDNLPQIQTRNFLEKLHYTWTEQEDWFGVYYVPDGKLAGLGVIWYVLLLPALLLAFIVESFRRGRFVLLAIPVLICFLVMPGNWIPHYAMLITFIGAIAFAVVMGKYMHLRLLKAALVILLILLSGYTTVMMHNGGLFNLRQIIGDFKNIGQQGVQKTLQLGDIQKYLSIHTTPNEVVAYGQSVLFPYALYVDDYRNDVRYLPQSSETADEWLRQLRSQGVRYICLAATSTEGTYAAAHPEQFELVVDEGDQWHVLYQIHSQN